MNDLHNSLLLFTRQSHRTAWALVAMAPVTLIKALFLSVQVFGWTVWSEVVEGESVVQAVWRKR